MPKAPRLTAADAEGMLHPKIVKQVLEAIEEASIQPSPPE
jgi:putative aminopeptidase FrvX